MVGSPVAAPPPPRTNTWSWSTTTGGFLGFAAGFLVSRLCALASRSILASLCSCFALRAPRLRSLGCFHSPLGESMSVGGFRKKTRNPEPDHVVLYKLFYWYNCYDPKYKSQFLLTARS